jgi:hypothetical protein
VRSEAAALERTHELEAICTAELCFNCFVKRSDDHFEDSRKQLLVSEEPSYNVQPGDQDEKITEHGHIDAGPIPRNGCYICIVVAEIVALISVAVSRMSWRFVWWQEVALAKLM